ncbi:beta-ketoacyl-ACP synthase I [Verminephrobacter aporrectodeae]|uniref:3-oxoacyl-[acyl-carrier-protein] synthase 1 n=1 Tax=Verminephrobacter aporrectodeae subsp. tuberculatae TaxID=1110392 RepID=A0ABT3KV18_9BURK|nr:beta-ketoacyl-ACP synthase I [Verminephrobacter aporrectodeae]MCW5223111.1 beta-ketoacyl-ACP synthase I [Verminephrobacter aporrectodeae subsp. tuberculatae]MCW5256671.1 beta-ketoacyl-ACP synthase I [Verminephrobacter aporrectodeae subsp. tuberculatae]MCW5288575.1 beta-ketoacyl-ACP synthase I [Verminephrobacter aporrectodeae subsp. tuberculatae]MCW5322163.1 beta-ketoacyl-ACP synthase I [Verminephrobacter aporrectodeae subsp. tuberculatae]MCW8176625.1 beta-ketoacyl-ACP synthase I [Verminephr
MKRVVITGAGIVSCIGNDMATVTQSLRAGRSGIRAMPQFTELGMRSQVAGVPQIDLEKRIDRKQLRFMGDAAAYAHVALADAIAQAGLAPGQVSHPRTGLIMGSGGGSPANQIEAADILRSKGIRRVGPYQVTRCMGSTVSACLSTHFGVKGVNYSITSACSTSAHCIGAAAQQIAWGMQDVVFAGGGEEVTWGMGLLFDAMGAMSSAYNATPEKASRAYDAHRDGFVLSGGGGAVVLESLEHAQARGAAILGEIIGFGATSDGADMVAPSGDGAVACMRQAIATATEPIDYINTHGTSTPVGDVPELHAIRRVFGAQVPPFSSTKSLTGHSLGATGVQEAIYCLLMLSQGFIAGSANIETLDPAAEGLPLVRETRAAPIRTALSNSFGFGGTNASLVLRRWEH